MLDKIVHKVPVMNFSSYIGSISFKLYSLYVINIWELPLFSVGFAEVQLDHYIFLNKFWV